MCAAQRVRHVCRRAYICAGTKSATPRFTSPTAKRKQLAALYRSQNGFLLVHVALRRSHVAVPGKVSVYGVLLGRSMAFRQSGYIEPSSPRKGHYRTCTKSKIDRFHRIHLHRAQPAVNQNRRYVAKKRRANREVALFLLGCRTRLGRRSPGSIRTSPQGRPIRCRPAEAPTAPAPGQGAPFRLCPIRAQDAECAGAPATRG